MSPTRALDLHQEGPCPKAARPEEKAMPLSLFGPTWDFSSSEEAKREGQERAEEHAVSSSYARVFMRALKACALSGQPFTSEEVRQVAGEPTVYGAHPSSVGALMTSAGKKGYIEQTGDYRKATSKRSHAAMLALWVGTERAREMV